MNKYELTILAPAYNEEKNITLFLKEFIPKIPDNWSILIVNDGSEDSTEQEVLEFKSKYDNVYLISHSKNLGLGKAFETGFKNLNSEFVITIDADMSHGFEMVNILYENRKKASIILASIFDKESNTENASKLRLIISKLGNFVLSKLFKFSVKEIAGGPRLYESKYVKDLVIDNPGFECQIEILLKTKKQGASFAEVPIILKSREYGVSKMNYFKMGIGILKVYKNLYR
jgi:dolichol-phosphate mannosyltransferase